MKTGVAKYSVIRFIHIPKNGGTTVEKTLRRNGVQFLLGTAKDDSKDLLSRHNTAWHYVQEPSYKFTVSRNPYTRMVSWYNWIRRNQRYHDKIPSFDFFIKEQFRKGRARRSWHPQSHWICDLRGNIIVDKIYKMENMENEIRKDFTINGKFLHLNASTIDEYMDYYTEETIDIVNKVFKEDFLLLDYDMIT